MARLAALSCLLAFGCGGSSHTPGDAGDGGGHPRDGGLADGGVDASDAAATPDDCGAMLSVGASFGVPEVPHIGTATATVVGVEATGVDLDVGGTRFRFAWPGGWAESGLDRLAPGMEVELTQFFGGSRLVAPDVTLHAFVGFGNYPMEPFLEPIVIDGAPPIDLASRCEGMVEGACGPVQASAYDLTVGTSERLARGESTSGDGYAIHFEGSSYYRGLSTDVGCVDEAWFGASIAVRVDAAPATCESIEDDYARTIEQGSTCTAGSDCRVISGHCGRGLGGCWYAVSADIEDELAGLAERYSDLGCTTAVCRCTAAPDTVVCDSGRCAFPP